MPEPTSAPNAVRPAAVSLVIGSGNVKCAAAIALGLSVEQTRAGAERLRTRETTSRRSTRKMLRPMAPRLCGFSAETFGLRDTCDIERGLQGFFGERAAREPYLQSLPGAGLSGSVQGHV